MYEKVVIVGAGPAGLSAAIKLLEQDHTKEVTVVERRKVIGEPQRCAGGLNLERAKRSGVQVPEEVIVSRIKRILFKAPNETAEFDLTKFGLENFAIVMNRRKFDQYLAKKAEELGAQIILGTEAVGIGKNATVLEIGPGRGIVEGEVPFDYCVAAAGFKEGRFSNKWESGLKLKDMAICLQHLIYTPDYPQDTMTFSFGSKIAPGGYAWVFPCGNGRVRIGLGIPASIHANLREYLANYTRSMDFDLKATEETIGKTLPTTKLPKTGMIGNNIFLVGDQLHATDPLTGGGILPAIQTGRAAAMAIAGSSYDKLWKKMLPDHNRRYRAKKIYSLPDKTLDKLIRVLSTFKPKKEKAGVDVKEVLIHLAKNSPKLLVHVLDVFI